MPVKPELAAHAKRTHCNLWVAHLYATTVQHRRTEEKISVSGRTVIPMMVDRATERTILAFQALCNQA
jgi:hypothetical protein